MSNAVKLTILVSVEVTEENVLRSTSSISVDGNQVGFVSRMRIDMDSSDVIPSVEIDMLRGQSLDLVSESIRSKAQEGFDALKRVPGVKCVMPAPRI